MEIHHGLLLYLQLLRKMQLFSLHKNVYVQICVDTQILSHAWLHPAVKGRLRCSLPVSSAQSLVQTERKSVSCVSGANSSKSPRESHTDEIGICHIYRKPLLTLLTVEVKLPFPH